MLKNLITVAKLLYLMNAANVMCNVFLIFNMVIKKFDCDDEIYIFIKYISLIVKNRINGLFAIRIKFYFTIFKDLL